MSCPCGFKRALSDCCGGLHAGLGQASTAEELMRSRYSAYVCGAVEYIVRTTLPEQQSALDREGILAWSQESNWLGLTIVRCETGDDENEAFVEFRAEFESGGIRQSHGERSHFVRRDERWYFDSQLSSALKGDPAAIVGRNEPCPCGSGKKHKKCCWR